MPLLPMNFVIRSNHDRPNHAQLPQDLVIELVKRVKVPINSSTSPAQRAEMLQDPWETSGKYALGWVYFGIILLFCATAYRMYDFWGDKIRIALYKDKAIRDATEMPPIYARYESPPLGTASPNRHSYDEIGPQTARSYKSTMSFFQAGNSAHSPRVKQQASISSIRLIHRFVAMLRFVFYRQVRVTLFRSQISSPSSLGATAVGAAGLVFCVLYCLSPRPLFFSTMAFGSPPLAVRAGMLSVSIVPWIVVLASKVNIVSYLTGISTERLVVFHSWTAYICVILALIHAVPLWWQSAQDPTGFRYFNEYFFQQDSIFTTGVAALAPLLFLVVHSLPILRRKAYELFVLFHIPIAWASIGLLFWHCNNYLTSWAYLYSTTILLAFSLFGRLFYVNWSNPMNDAFAIGEDAAITILAEGAVKISIPTKRKWNPGQYVYLRIPGIALLDHHPFTITSLCSDEYQSQYAEGYRNMTMIFRPYQGFTQKAFHTAMEKGSRKTYRAFIEGPYGGMRRQLSSFDQVIFLVGGVGMAGISPRLLSLVKRMRESRAVTNTIHVIWAMKRPESISWFGREFGYCRDFSVPDSVHCKFYITADARYQSTVPRKVATPARQETEAVDFKEDGTTPYAAPIHVSKSIEAFGFERDQKQDDYITALPQSHVAPPKFAANPAPYFPPPPAKSKTKTKNKRVPAEHQLSTLSSVYSESQNSLNTNLPRPQPLVPANSLPSIADASTQDFDFQFDRRQSQLSSPSTSTQPLLHPQLLTNSKLQTNSSSTPPPSRKRPNLSINIKNANSAYTNPHNLTNALHEPPVSLPPRPKKLYNGWKTEYGRPDVPAILSLLSNDFGRRTCVFVCGPPDMRRDVARTVADLQKTVWQGQGREELFLHTENWAM